MQEYYQMTDQQAREAVNGTSQPLTDDQVRKNQEKFGPNELVEEKKKSVVQIFFEQFKDFLVIILIAAANISGILDD